MSSLGNFDADKKIYKLITKNEGISRFIKSIFWNISIKTGPNKPLILALERNRSLFIEKNTRILRALFEDKWTITWMDIFKIIFTKIITLFEAKSAKYLLIIFIYLIK